MRDLEGALKRVLANAHFFGQSINLDFVRETLRDLIAVHDRQISLDNIQRMVADYFKIKISDLLSKRRNRSVARPGKWQWRCVKNLQIIHYQKSVRPLGVEITQLFCTRVEKLKNCVTQICQFEMITAIC